jgi:hypothetical protein
MYGCFQNKHGFNFYSSFLLYCLIFILPVFYMDNCLQEMICDY